MNTDKIIAEKIASEYAPKKTNKVVALKKLDRKAKQTAEIFSFTFGIVSALVMGTGMCYSMGVIGENNTTSMIIGIIIGLIGIFGVSVSLEGYMFHKLTWAERIISLCAGLLLIYPGWVTDTIGIALFLIVVIVQLITRKKVAAA